MEFKYAENAKYLLMAFFGIIMTCLAYLIYIFNPLALIIDSMLDLRPGTFLFSMWEEPPLDMFAKIYIFNVTNPEEFLAGKAKLRVEEVGPYVYQEILKNTNPVVNDDGTMTYVPTREYVFMPELSVGDPTIDIVQTPNVPLLGMGSYLSTFNFFIRLGYNTVTSSMDEFKNLTVHQYLWGYEDRLVTLANTFIPSWIDFTEFGIIDRMRRRDSGNTVTIYLNETEDSLGNKIYPYSIEKVNGSPGLKVWNYHDVEVNETSEDNTVCNTVRGTYEGGLLPRNYPENVSLTVYRSAFCRPVRFNFQNKSVHRSGIDVFDYKVAEDFLGTPEENPDNKCYCLSGKCMPSGFNSLAPCYYGIPIIMSQPHYLNADEEIANQVEGLHPDPEKHDTTAQVSPFVGVPVEAHLRIQINIHVAENSFTKVRKFNNMILPLLWIELELQDLPTRITVLVKAILYVLPVAQDVIMWLLGILGISLVAAAGLIVFYFPPHRRLEDPYGHRIGYSPILVIPLSSRLRDTRIS